MKKTATLFICIVSAINLYAQNLVSTTPTTKNVLLEVLSGINCYYCAEAQYMGETMQNAQNNKIVWMNVHSGLFAQPNNNQPDFRSSQATEIAALSGISSYPAAMLNRSERNGLEQNGNSLAIASQNWQVGINDLLAENAPVNIAALADIDVATNELKVVVETYYTANVPSTNNKLFVALLLDSLWGPQAGAATLYPSALNDNGHFAHRYLFYDYINGASGTNIAASTQGSFRADTFIYPLPSNFNGTSIDFPNIKVAAWVAADSTDILNVAYAARTIGGPNPIATFIETAEWAVDFNQICGTDGDLAITIKNLGTDPISSIRVDYNINNGTSVGNMLYSFPTPIATGYSGSAIISNIQGLTQNTNTVDVSVGEINGLPNPNISYVNTIIYKAPLFVTDNNSGVFIVKFDNYPEDISWTLIDETAGTTVLTGNGLVSTNNSTVTETFSAVDGHCYLLKVLDANDDGLCCAYGQGFYSLSIGSVVLANGASFTSETGAKFQWQEGVLSTLPLAENTFDWMLFPNPAQNEVYLKMETQKAVAVSVQILNTLGQTVSPAYQYELQEGVQQIRLPLGELPTGLYMVAIQKGNTISTQKLMITQD